MLIDIAAMKKAAEETVVHYEKTAPIVYDWANNLYTKLEDDWRAVTLDEIATLGCLQANGWEHPNYAANRIYKLLDRLERDTTGMIDH